MARRRGFFRRAARSGFRGFKRMARRATAGNNNPLLVIGTGLVYGAARAPITRAIAPATSFLPFGNYNDEVGMGALGWFAMKQSNKYAKEAGHVILAVESFSVGAQATQGLMGGNSAGAWSAAYG